MNNPMLVKLQPGQAAPAGVPIFFIDGEQYFAVEGPMPVYFTGTSTYVPPPVTYSAPVPAHVDLSGVHHAIDQLRVDLNSVLRTHADSFERLAELLADALQQLAGATDARFDEVDQALRLLVDP